jgi:Obg family GTPase CgtA
MFVDHIKIFAKAGDGGHGCSSFRREKFEPKGGPDGGDGGRGGDVIIVVDGHTDNLRSFFFQPNHKAEKGRPGSGQKKTGRSGNHLILKVPPGTIVYRSVPNVPRHRDEDEFPDESLTDADWAGDFAKGATHEMVRKPRPVPAPATARDSPTAAEPAGELDEDEDVEADSGEDSDEFSGNELAGAVDFDGLDEDEDDEEAFDESGIDPDDIFPGDEPVVEDEDEVDFFDEEDDDLDEDDSDDGVPPHPYGEVIADLTEVGQKFVLCTGGGGGKGNWRFRTDTNQAPIEFTEGAKGDEGWYYLELRRIADIGLVGFPNAGKSTLLGAISNASPKVAAYPFTTLTPMVGVVEFPGFYRATVADIPGLIEGAHANVGLGHDFLRHISRCSYFLFVVDTAGVDTRDPISDLQILRKELKLYDEELSERPWLIVANKMDLPESAAYLEALKDRFPKQEIFPLSADTGEGIESLKKRLCALAGERPA